MRHTIAAIQATVAEFYGLSVKHMTGQCQERHIARPRQVAMYLARQLLPDQCNTLPLIAKRFGKRDHTTALYAIRITEQRRRIDADLDEDIETLRGRLVA